MSFFLFISFGFQIVSNEQQQTDAKKCQQTSQETATVEEKFISKIHIEIDHMVDANMHELCHNILFELWPQTLHSGRAKQKEKKWNESMTALLHIPNIFVEKKLSLVSVVVVVVCCYAPDDDDMFYSKISVLLCNTHWIMKP